MSSVHCNDRPTETRPSLAGPSRSSTPRAGPDPRKQSLIGNTHRLDTEDHFRTDVSHLPDLKSYLQQLLADAERLRAAADLQPWARAHAAPPDEQISQVRDLIRRIEADLETLTDADRARIQNAVATIRATRQAVMLGMPGC